MRGRTRATPEEELFWLDNLPNRRGGGFSRSGLKFLSAGAYERSDGFSERPGKNHFEVPGSMLFWIKNAAQQGDSPFLSWERCSLRSRHIEQDVVSKIIRKSARPSFSDLVNINWSLETIDGLGGVLSDGACGDRSFKE